MPSSPPSAVECQKPEPPPAWLTEPASNLMPLLSRISSPSGREFDG
ncbi:MULTISPECIES: lysis system o-spanin lipoprotein Rz1 [Achromobacter]